ncbi:MAG TPA: hypothetical protein VF458_00930, partial [Ktedonobacteraceae bacterium]
STTAPLSLNPLCINGLGGKALFCPVFLLYVLESPGSVGYNQVAAKKMSERCIMRSVLRGLKIGSIALVVALAAVLIFAFTTGHLLDVLYVTLIVLALFSLFSTILLIYSVMVLTRTIVEVREEMKPLLASVTETVDVAKETAVVVKETAQNAGKTAGTLVSTARLTKDYAVAPTVRAAALVLAGREMTRVFLGRGKARTRYEERRRKQEEFLRAEAAGGGE